jgi:hypothetical protein
MRDLFTNGVLLPLLGFMGTVFGAIIAYRRWKKMMKLITEIGGKSSKLVNSSDSKIWSDFIKPDFKSFNDPWIMESVYPNDFIETHRKRYKDPQCATFNFLFFTKNGYEPFKRFVKFQSIIHLGLEIEDVEADDFDVRLQEKIKAFKNIEKKLPDTLTHIKIYFNDEFQRPFITFFIGHKGKEKIALLYFSINENENRPHMIIQISDNETWNQLNNTWENAKEGAQEFSGIEIFDKYLRLTCK